MDNSMKRQCLSASSDMRLWFSVLVFCAVLLAGCADAGITRDDTATATPIETDQSDGPTPEPDASPAVMPSGEYLEIDGKRAMAIVVPADDIGATYVLTQDHLYRQIERTQWTRVTDHSHEVHVIADPGNTHILYRGGHPPCDIGGEEVTFEKSIDGGESWQELPNGRNIRPLLSTGGRLGIIYGERCHLAISVDGGETWTTHQTLPGLWVDNVALVENRLYVLHSSAGGTSKLSAMDVSDPSQPQPGETLLEFWGRGVVSASRDRVLVGEPQGIRISLDGGRTWSLSRERLDDVTLSVNALVEPIPPEEKAGEYGVLAIAVHPQSAQRIYIGTVRGLYLSQDNGQTWGRMSEVEEVPIRSLAFAHGGGQLYVTTDKGVAIVKNP